MKKLVVLGALIALGLMTACGGGSIKPSTTTPQSKPLDPQGNWLFIFTEQPSNTTFSVAGQLYELNPPTVTSNESGPVGTIICGGSFTFNGQASGTNTINLTADQVVSHINPVSLSLTGTIAADEQHMSGTWNVSKAGTCLGSGANGSWSAQLIVPVTGNWSGTMSNSTTDLTVTAALTEVTDQTTPVMGQVTGTVTLLGSPCFSSSDALNISPWSANGSPGIHGGETLIIMTDPDASGVHLETVGSVTPDGTTFTPLTFTILGGVCDGQTFSGTLTH